MEDVKFYTTHCPQCRGVKLMLDSKKIKYEEIVGEQPIVDLGYSSAPLLKVGDTIYCGADIHNWIRSQN